MNTQNIPSVGSVVSVVTKHRNIFLPTYKEHPFTYDKYVGTVVHNPKWLGADYVSVETGNPMYPVSMIKFANIESLDIVSGGKVSFQEFPVEGSKGKMYNVKKSGDHYSCNCTGFKYHGSCKHINLVKDDRYE